MTWELATGAAHGAVPFTGLEPLGWLAGAGSLIEGLAIGWPTGPFDTLAKVVTAVVALVVALVLWRAAPGTWARADLKRLCTDLETEIAARRTVEAALKVNERRYRSLADASTSAIWVAGEAGEFLEDQPSWAAWTGQVRDEYVRAGWLEAFHPKDRPRLKEAWASALDHGQPWSIHARLWNHEHGEYRRCECRAVPVRQPGATDEWIGSVTDDEDRRRAEELFRQVIEAAPNGFALVDPEGSIALVNSSMERMSGYDRAELVGQPVEVLVPEELRARHVEHRRAFLERPAVRPMAAAQDLHVVRADGARFPAEIGLNPVAIEGTPHVLCSIVDITERKFAEDKLAEYAQELSRSNTDLEDFAYMASHDLKEPLRGIRRYSAFVLEDHADELRPEAHDKLVTIGDLVARMERLIDSLLHYSRVGYTNLAMARYPLDDVVTEVVESMKPTLDELGASIRRPHPLPTVECDRVRIGELFRNLITNAAKYNDKAERWIEIGCEQREVPVLYVRDNGIGIAPKHRSKVFGIFKRLHGRDEFGGGTGAGLTIARKIVERHGGELWCESEEGVGTTFCFTLGQVPAAAHTRMEPAEMHGP